MNFTTAPAFSLPQTQRKVFDQADLNNSGPFYNTFGLNKKHNSLSHGIGKSSRYDINHGVQKTPAPGQYNPEKITISKTMSIPKFQVKDKQSEKQSPDPAYYQPNYQFSRNKVLSHSMGSKYACIMDDVKNIPGPGSYETIPVLSRPKSYQPSQRLRRSKSNLTTIAPRFKQAKTSPGPGEYDLLSQDKILSHDKKGKFGTGSKNMNIKQITPGPSEYGGMSRLNQAMKYKLGKTFAPKPKNSSLIPAKDLTKNAFAKYDVGQKYKLIKQKVGAFSIGKSLRRIFQGSNTPSPLQYLKQNYSNKNTFRATMALSQRSYSCLGDNPGPGTYQLIHKKTSTYTIPRSQSINILSANPGVGRYDVEKGSIQKGQKGLKFQNSKRTNFVSSNSAGVGDYEIQNKKKQTATMPKSQRFANKTQIQKPGPGDYHIPSSIGRYNTYAGNKPKKV